MYVRLTGVQQELIKDMYFSDDIEYTNGKFYVSGKMGGRGVRASQFEAMIKKGLVTKSGEKDDGTVVFELTAQGRETAEGYLK